MENITKAMRLLEEANKSNLEDNCDKAYDLIEEHGWSVGTIMALRLLMEVNSKIRSFEDNEKILDKIHEILEGVIDGSL